MTERAGLKRAELELIARHRDGERLSVVEREGVERVLAQSSLARVYSESVRELGEVVRAAEGEWWEGSGAPSAGEVAEWARLGGEGEELSSLLSRVERYHDGEVVGAEAAELVALLEGGGEAAAYAGVLGELRLGVEAAAGELGAGVDFGGMWSRLEARLDAEEMSARAVSGGGKVLSFPGGLSLGATRERPKFKGEDHQVLLYRYHDGEVSAEERAQVGAWSELDGGVASTLGALSELRLAVNVAVEQAQERVDMGAVWAGLEGRLEHRAVGSVVSGGVSEVVSLAAHRAVSHGPGVSERRSHRREIGIALAAVLCTVFGIALFGDRLFGAKQVIVERTVVIVDTVEYGEGTSVMVTGPLRAASYEPAEVSVGEEEESSPTVIWLIDPEQEPASEEGDGSQAPGSGDEPRQGRPI